MTAKKVMVLQHKNEMVYSREFFDMQMPKEINILLYTVYLLCFFILGFIIFGRMDDVIKSDGIIRTRDNVSSLKNVISGTIQELHYSPGQKVCKGDVLYRLDPTDYNIQKENLLMNKEYLEGCLKGNSELIKSYYAGENLVSQTDKISYTKFESYESELEKLSIRESIAKQEYDRENGKSALIRVRYNIKMKSKEYELAKSTLDAYRKGFIADLFAEKKDLEMQLEVIRQNIAQLENKFAYLSVTAPVDGYVQEVSSLNVGDYIEQEMEVLNIIPNDSRNFRVEIQVPTKDIGKVSVNMRVKFRLSAFPYFEYRGAEGVITSVDPDIHRNKEGELYYSVYSTINRVEFSNRHGDVFPIRAGIETKARIVIGTNTILHYILKKMDFLY